MYVREHPYPDLVNSFLAAPKYGCGVSIQVEAWPSGPLTANLPGALPSCVLLLGELWTGLQTTVVQNSCSHLWPHGSFWPQSQF
jgi:hypothetical protein